MRDSGFGVETGLHRIVYLIFICSKHSKNDYFLVVNNCGKNTSCVKFIDRLTDSLAGTRTLEKLS